MARRGDRLIHNSYALLDERGLAKAYVDVPGLCKAASLAEIEAQGFSFNPGRYVGATAREAESEDFREKLEELQEEFERLTGEARELETAISLNVAEVWRPDRARRAPNGRPSLSAKPTSAYLTDHMRLRRQRHGPVFLGIGNLTDDGHLTCRISAISTRRDFPAWTKRVTPRPGDIVFTYEATLNRYTIIPEGFRGCLGRRLALICPNPATVDTRFLFYTFFSKEWRDTVASNTISGATVERIPIYKFPEFPIRLPSLPIQKQIASILSAYDDLIENNSRRIAILEEMARCIFEEWFVHFRAPGCEGLPMVESAIGPCRRDGRSERSASLHRLTRQISPKEFRRPR